MCRPARILEEGAVYHVTCRGNNKGKVFHVGLDYRKYMLNLIKNKNKYKFYLYAYALLPNHLHLLMKPKQESELSHIMNSLNLSYAIWHNRRYDCVGHVWQGRYGSRIIKDDRGMLICMSYIERNPIEAGVTEDVVSYKWCSYRERFSKSEFNLIDYHPAYLELAATQEERRCNYNAILFEERLSSTNTRA